MKTFLILLIQIVNMIRLEPIIGEIFTSRIGGQFDEIKNSGVIVIVVVVKTRFGFSVSTLYSNRYHLGTIGTSLLLLMRLLLFNLNLGRFHGQFIGALQLEYVPIETGRLGLHLEQLAYELRLFLLQKLDPLLLFFKKLVKLVVLLVQIVLLNVVFVGGQYACFNGYILFLRGHTRTFGPRGLDVSPNRRISATKRKFFKREN